MRFVLYIFVCMLLVTPTMFVYGQVTTNLMGAAVSITLDSQFPNPGDVVIATLDDYSTNSSGATITWYFEGHELPAMKNKRTITVPADSNGANSKVMVKLSFSNRPTLATEATIRPIYLDVIVEPQTYTPVFYAGRALPVFGSLVNLIAITQLQAGSINPITYSYNWELNGKSLYGGPQQGTNRAQITIPYGLSSTLILSVTTKEGTLIGRRLITIPSVPLDLEFYEESALYGLGQRALEGNVHIIGSATTIRAVPYYISNDVFTGNTLMSNWSINGVPNTTDLTDPFEINLRSENIAAANVGFTVRNLAALIQSATKAFTVNF